MPKQIKILDAEITEDGCIKVSFNSAGKVYPHTADAIFTPEALLSLIEEYGDIPPAGDTDYPGVPIVDEDMIFDGDGETVKRDRKDGKAKKGKS
jgi:hypothetical protein